MESIGSPYCFNNDSPSPKTPGSASVLRKLERIPNCTIDESTRHTNEVLQNEAWSFCTGDDDDEKTSTSVDELETVRSKVAMIETKIVHGGLGTIDSCATTRDFLRRRSIVRNSIDDMFRDTSSLSADASPFGGRMSEDFSPRLARSEGGRTPSSNTKRSHARPRETRRISLCVGDSSDDDSLSDEAGSTTPNEHGSTHGGGKSRGRYESAFDLDWSRAGYDDAAVGKAQMQNSPRANRKLADAADSPSMVPNALGSLCECTEALPQVDDAASHRNTLTLEKEAFLWVTGFVLIVLLVCIVMALVYQLGMRHGLEYAKRCHIELDGLLSRTVPEEL